jgi:hypothetical protein
MEMFEHSIKFPHGLKNPTDDLLKNQWDFSIRGGWGIKKPTNQF